MWVIAVVVLAVVLLVVELLAAGCCYVLELADQSDDVTEV